MKIQVNQQNRLGRRIEKSREKHLETSNKKTAKAVLDMNMAKQREDKVKRRVKASQDRREIRDKFRKAVAEKAGVNYKRVVLKTKIEEGKIIDYSIRGLKK